MCSRSVVCVDEWTCGELVRVGNDLKDEPIGVEVVVGLYIGEVGDVEYSRNRL